MRGSQDVEYEGLRPGDLIEWPSRRTLTEAVSVYVVVEVKERQQIDWDEADQQAAAKAQRGWKPPLALVIRPLKGGKVEHWGIRGGYYRRVQRLDPHHPICADCGGYWPCQHSIDDATAAQFARELDNVCDHCGKPVKSGSIGYGGEHLDIPGQIGAKFHTTKRFPKCIRAAEAYRVRWQARLDADRATRSPVPVSDETRKAQ